MALSMQIHIQDLVYSCHQKSIREIFRNVAIMILLFENEVNDMTKPMIALSSRLRVDPNTNRIFYDNESYYEFIRLGGGIGSVVHATSIEDAKEIAKHFDGLLLTGGEDVNPSLYHEENTKSDPIHIDIENSDTYLYFAFKELHKPILGICRGIQIINVLEKGSLIQDIHTYDSSKLNHSQITYNPPIGMHDYCHSCTFVEGTKLYELFGKEHEVNSFHHQAIKEVANGFKVSAYSEDGLIEGIEKDTILAVQWHPERLVHDPNHLAISKYFIDICNANLKY